METYCEPKIRQFQGLFCDISFEEAMFLSFNTDLPNAIEEVQESRPIPCLPVPQMPIPPGLVLHRQFWNLKVLLDWGVESKARAAQCAGALWRVPGSKTHGRTQRRSQATQLA